MPKSQQIAITVRLRHAQLGCRMDRPMVGDPWKAFAAWRIDQFGALMFKGSTLGRVLLGLGKLVLGAVALSPFAVINGLYSLGIGTAGFFCLETENDALPPVAQHRRFRLVGVIVTIASLIYVLYATRLFLTADPFVFSQSIALAIATITFTELVINARQAIVRRNDPSPLVQAAKMANLASALTSLALVQTAIRSIADPTGGSVINAWGGLFCGGLAVLVGLCMIVLATVRLRAIH